MKHALIFDLDGTLVDSLAGIGGSLNRALAASSLPTHPLSAVRRFIGNGARVLIQRAVPAGAEDCLLDAVEQCFKDDYDLTWPSGTCAYDGILSLLESLQARGYLLAVLSNKPHSFATAMVAQMFPAVRFAMVLGQRGGVPHKPDPAGALEISAALGVSARSCTVIGDSTMDIETAKNAGMKSIAVTWGFHDYERLLAAGADQLVNAPADLLQDY